MTPTHCRYILQLQAKLANMAALQAAQNAQLVATQRDLLETKSKVKEKGKHAQRALAENARCAWWGAVPCAVRVLSGRCQDLRATYSKVESDFFLLDSTFFLLSDCCKSLSEAENLNVAAEFARRWRLIGAHDRDRVSCRIFC